MADLLKEIEEANSYIRSKTGFQPQYGIILGTGLGGLAGEIKVEAELEYGDIPHFPVSTVESHEGKLLFGTIGEKNIVAMQGRFHYYEGYSMQQVTFPVRVLKKLGIERLFISNVSGSLNPDILSGDLMIINDHIYLQPENPLRGKNYEELGPRFADMSRPYDPEMIDKASAIAESNSIKCHKGVYVTVPGPNLETKAEYKYLRIIGGDAVGMSTIPEVIVARHMGLSVFAISVITDEGFHEDLKEVQIEDILAVAAEAEPKMTQVIKELIVSL